MRQMTLSRYVARGSREPGVREHTKSAVASSRRAYQRLNKAKSPAAALNDKKLRRDLRRASSSAGAAGAIVISTPGRMRTRDAVALGAMLSTLLIAAAVLFARSEKVRAKRHGNQSDQVEEPNNQPPAESTPAAPVAPAEPGEPLG